jgi:heme/copper-type cytochrome/quinol oxidase subunit 2
MYMEVPAMKRSNLHLTVDIALFLSVLSLLWTGLLMSFVLPAGSRAATVWGWTRHEWGDLHFYLAVTMITVAALHVALNWGWVCNVAVRLLRPRAAAPSHKARNIAGTVLVLLIVGFIAGLLWAAQSARTGIGEGRGQGQALHESDHDPAGDAHPPRQGTGWRGGRYQ